MQYPTRPFAARVWRMVAPGYHHLPLSGEGARLWGGRWNMKGWPALYLATDHATAIAEYLRGLPRPGTLVPFDVDAGAIVDLTGDDPRVAEALACDWARITRTEGVVPASWALAQQLIDSGAAGALVPSTQHRGGTNVVLWRWHAAGEKGEGAALTLIDPDAVLGVEAMQGGDAS